MINKIYVVIASANKGQDWIICKALYGGILGAEFQKQARDMLEKLYQDIKKHGKRIPRKYFKIVEYSDNAELLKQIERLQKENATLKSNLGECEVNYSAALHYAREDNKKLQAENADLKEKWDNQRCIYSYDGEAMEYCVNAPCEQERTIAKVREENTTLLVQTEQTKKALELACHDIARCYHPNGDWASLKNEYYREYIAKAKKGQ